MKNLKSLALSAFIDPFDEKSPTKEIILEEDTHSDYLKVCIANVVQIRLTAAEALQLANVLLNFAANKLETELV